MLTIDGNGRQAQVSSQDHSHSHTYLFEILDCFVQSRAEQSGTIFPDPMFIIITH